MSSLRMSSALFPLSVAKTTDTGNGLFFTFNLNVYLFVTILTLLFINYYLGEKDIKLVLIVSILSPKYKFNVFLSQKQCLFIENEKK